MTTFVLIIILLASMAAVAWPLLKGNGQRRGRPPAEDPEVSETLAHKDAALLAISELEADFEMGNLSEGDYRHLRAKYDEQALALLKEVDEMRHERAGAADGRLDEEIETMVSGLRGGRSQNDKAANNCPTCGAPLPARAAFCARCGAALENRCPACAAAVGAGDRFCFRCGADLRTAINQ